jgi:RecG-like helicase
VLWEALEKYGATVPEDLPETLVARYGFPRAAQAVREIHFPKERGEEAISDLIEFRTRAHQRLIYEEFLKFEYLVLRQRHKMERLNAASA